MGKLRPEEDNPLEKEMGGVSLGVYVIDCQLAG